MKKKVKKATKTISLRDLLMSSKNTITLDEFKEEIEKKWPKKKVER